MAAPAQFYSYLWLREDGTPYYAGKGSHRRAFDAHYRERKIWLRPPDKSRILIFPMLNEAEALESEIALIELFGRKDLDPTGLLRNFTNGGDGISGLKHTEKTKEKMRNKVFSDETRQRMSKAQTGRTHSTETRQKLSEANSGQIPWSKGKKLGPRSDEVKIKISEGTKRAMKSVNLKGKKRSDAARENIRAGTLKRGPVSENTRKKISTAGLGRIPWNKGLTGQHRSEEAKKNMRDAWVCRKVQEGKNQ